MGLIEDAKALAGLDPAGERPCPLCGATEGHALMCPTFSLPRIVAALEAAGRTLNSNVQVVRTWYDEYNGWKMSCGSCLRTVPKGGLLTSEFPHKPDCPWQALVEAMRDAP